MNKVLNKIKVKLKSYDYKLLDKYVEEIIKTAFKFGSKISGPISLPTKISKYTVLKGPFVDKKSREQFEIRIHKRLIYILDVNKQLADVLAKIEVSGGVEISIKTV